MRSGAFKNVILAGVLSIAIAAGVLVFALHSSASSLRDIDNVDHGTLEGIKPGRLSLLFFMTADCPIANQYAPELQRICSQYGPNGVDCFLVYADPSMTPAQIRKHQRDFYHGAYPAIFDSRHNLVNRAGATISSEVAVFSHDAELQYRGRIDDLYADLGTSRQHATQRDLRDALDDLIAGRKVQHSRTQAVGCFLPDTAPEG